MTKRLFLRWFIGPNFPFLVVLSLGIYGAWGGWHQILVAVDHYGSAAPSPGKADAVLDKSLPVISKANVAFGNLADATGDWSDASQQQARDVRALLSAGGRTLDAATEAGKSAKGTAEAATGALDQARVDFGTLNGSIAATKPLIEAGTSAIGRVGVASDDLDALLKRKAVGEILDNMAGITVHGNAIAGDFQQVADKARADYLRPVPWYMQPVKRAADIMDISAAVARHTP